MDEKPLEFNEDTYANFDLDSMLSADDEKSELDKIFELMLKPENLHHVTDLTNDEINAYNILGVIANRYGLKILKEWILTGLTLRVSRNREGRKEIIKLSSRNPQNMMDENRKRMFEFRRS